VGPVVSVTFQFLFLEVSWSELNSECTYSSFQEIIPS
jgi:hypothetical protein